MHHSGHLFDIIIFLTAAIIVVPIFQKFRASAILGYLAAGIIIGPHSLAIIGDTASAKQLAEFGVIFLLFTIGLELSFERLQALGKKVFGLGSLQVGITALVIGFVAWMLGQDVNAAVIIGGGLALSSTAFVMQLLIERGERATPFGLSTFSILLLQDLAVVPLLLMVTLLGASGSTFTEAFGAGAIKGGLGMIAAVFFGRYLLRPLYQMIASMRSPELFVATTILIVLVMGVIMSSAGFSMELGALIAGLLLAETEYRHQIEADIRPFKGILLGLFFMTIGMSIDLLFILNNMALILALVIALLLGKSIITATLSRLYGLPSTTSIRTGFALAQGGEFGFVIFGAALSLSIITDYVGQILLAVIALSMLATPTMFYLSKLISGYLEKQSAEPFDTIDDESEELNNHILIAGFGRVGQTVAKVVCDAGFSYVALDLDQSRVKQCRANGMPVYYGNADHLNVLQAAGAARAKLAIITLDNYDAASKAVKALHDNYPDLPIYVRARDRKHLTHLEEVGATAVVSEAAESSLQLGSIVLNSLDVSADEIVRVIQEYREDEYARLDEIIDGKQRAS